jgi:molecular chaperone DnaK
MTMTDGPVLGIDLGTTNSVVAVADGGQSRVLTDEHGRPMTPSVVAFLPDGGAVVGYEARDRRLTDAANTVYSVKRLIGRPFQSPEVARARGRFAFELVPNDRGAAMVKVERGEFALAEISAIVLRELKRMAEQALGMAVSRAVITVPANFNELQRSATKAAGKVAGLEVLRILNEPTAAALAYGYGARQRERVAVYDLGGGTFDITVLELDGDVFEVLATGGDSFLGGEDLDRTVAERMCDRFALQHGLDLRADPQAFERLKAAAEWAKCQLTSEDAVELVIEDLARGENDTPLDLEFVLSRQELEDAVRPWLERSLKVCSDTLAASGLTPKQLDSVVLVGGSTRMPLCRRMVAAHFGREPRTDIDPDLVVAQGAAIHGFVLGGRRAAPIPAQQPVIPLPITAIEGLPRQPAFALDEHALLVASQRAAAEAQARAEAEAAWRQAEAARREELPSPDSRVAVVAKHRVVTVGTSIDDPFGDDLLGGPADGAQSAPPAQVTPAAARSASGFAAPDSGGLLDYGLDLADLLEPEEPAGSPRTGTRPAVQSDASQPFAQRAAGMPAAQHAHYAPNAHLGGISAPPGPSATHAPGAIGATMRIDVPAVLALPMRQVIAMPQRQAPLLMDVTPHSLGLETAGGFCRRLIRRNAPVPTEQMRTFTTARDGQDAVVVRVCQGESEQFNQNEVLGEVILDQLPPRPRGQVTIQVTFILDADGTLSVQARDAQSGRAQSIRINLRGGLDEGEVEAMRARQERMS